MEDFFHDSCLLGHQIIAVRDKFQSNDDIFNYIHLKSICVCVWCNNPILSNWKDSRIEFEAFFSNRHQFFFVKIIGEAVFITLKQLSNDLFPIIQTNGRKKSIGKELNSPIPMHVSNIHIHTLAIFAYRSHSFFNLTRVYNIYIQNIETFCHLDH